MMSDWHGYILLDKPAALSVPQWAAAATALASVLGRAQGDHQPAKRMQARRRLDNQAVIFEALLDDRDLDVNNLTRLCKYIADALSGAFTPTQVRTGLQSRLTIFGGLSATWPQSGTAARAFLSANSAAWESST